MSPHDALFMNASYTAVGLCLIGLCAMVTVHLMIGSYSSREVLILFGIANIMTIGGLLIGFTTTGPHFLDLWLGAVLGPYIPSKGWSVSPGMIYVMLFLLDNVVVWLRLRSTERKKREDIQQGVITNVRAR